MYECSICQAEVAVDHINPPVRSCSCLGGTIIAGMSGGLAGKGELNATTEPSVCSESMTMIRAMVIGVSAYEFFQNGMKKVVAKDLIIVDAPTGRKFRWNITGEEI